MKTLKLKSPGKVNLRLDVLSRRADGYHELRMLNSAVSVYDDVEIEIIERGIVVECTNDPLAPTGEDNIVYRAAKEIMAYSNKNVGVQIRITKQIPTGAGMGGGSSNAAAVIQGVNQLLKINLPKEKLMKIGVRFGADIPFFIFGSPAIATGIGENLTRVKRLPSLPMVIVHHNIFVSTQSVYERYRPNVGPAKEEMPVEFPTKKAVAKFLHNDLESVTVKQYPVVTSIKEQLMKLGALGASMTGSGPSVFGIFADREAAEKAYKRLVHKGNGDTRVFMAENV